MNRWLPIAIAAVILIAFLATGSLYIIEEGQQAVITQFGQPVAVDTSAGLKVKLPFIQTVNRLEKRLMPWDGAPENIPTKDKKRIFVDVWARWRIADPMQFYRSVQTVQRGHGILDEQVDSVVRTVVGRHDLIEVVRSTNRPMRYETEELSEERTSEDKIDTGRGGMEEEILAAVAKELQANEYGIEVTQVRIKRVNYVQSVRQSVYERMRAERLRVAQLFESEAQEEKNRILGKMRRELEQIEGETQRKSEEIRGKADAEVTRITAEAFSKSPELFDFLRRLEAYRSVTKNNTRLILSTDNEFFRLLVDPIPGKDGD